MKQTKQFLRPLLMAIVMLVGMLVPKGAWAGITLITESGDDVWCESMHVALEVLTEYREVHGYNFTTMRIDENTVLDEELDCYRLGQDITIDLNGCVLTNDPWAVGWMSCIVYYRGCDYRITIQNGTIVSNELDAICFHGISPDPNYQLVLKNVNVVTHQEGRHCLFDAYPYEWEDWGNDYDPERAPKLQIIDSEFHSNGCSAISFTFQRNDEYVKSILPVGHSFYNANTDVELVEYADRPFVDENGNPATDIRTGDSPDLPKIKISDPDGYEDDGYCGNFKQAMDIYGLNEMTLTLLDNVKEGLCTTNDNKSVTIDLNGHTLDITHLSTNYGDYLNIIDSSEGKTGKLIVERFDVYTPAENNAVIEGNVKTWGDDMFTNNGLVEYVDGGFINNGDFITSWTWADDHSSATLRINHEDVDAVVTNEDTTPATCIASGVRTYTAAATYRDRNYADTKDEEIAIDPNAHDFTSKTLTAEPDEHGLYAYACDRGCDAHSDDHIIKDGVAFHNSTELTTSGVTMNRTFTAEKPATIMLPFSIDASALATVDDDVVTGAKFYGFTSLEYNDVTGKWEANMDRVTGTIQAYTPYMIVLTEGTTIDFGENEVTFPATPAELNNTTQGDWTFVATNEDKVWTSEDFGNGQAYYGYAAGNETTPEGMFVKVGVDASIAPLRAYLMKTPQAGPNNAPAHAMAAGQVPSTITVRLNDGGTTGIGTLNTETGELSFDGWYDMQGRRINKPAKNGISIINGKKVFVK